MLVNAREARRRTLLTSNLHPPEGGLNADPILYGVAAGLASLFPPVAAQAQDRSEPRGHAEGDRPGDRTASR
ncbi:MAG: hypothetical protein EKK43_14410 [Methylobacterium sp.]|nr:MAG: hypothetical protein EKK43_14410 [Methylobacterium sp.]